MWPYVQINNLNQQQGAVTEVERHLLFIGSAPENTGKLLSVNTQSDFDKLLGSANSDLKTNLQAAMDNAGQNWTAAAYVLPTNADWKDAVLEAQKTQSFEGVVVLGQDWDTDTITAAHTLNQTLIAKWGRYQFMLLEARARLRHELPGRLSAQHKRFLSGLTRAQPDWSLLQCQHAAQLPALRWKLSNLETFRKRRPEDFTAQADALDAGLGQA